MPSSTSQRPASRRARPCRRRCRASRGRRSARASSACSSSGFFGRSRRRTARRTGAPRGPCGCRRRSPRRRPRVDIGGADEGVGELARRIAADEIFLVHARGELDHLGRDFEEAASKRPSSGTGHSVSPAFSVTSPSSSTSVSPALRAAASAPIADDRAALVLVDDDVAGAQLFGIVVARRRW